MSVHVPLDPEKLFQLWEKGCSHIEMAGILGRPAVTIGSSVKRWRDRGILSVEDRSVDREAYRAYLAGHPKVVAHLGRGRGTPAVHRPAVEEHEEPGGAGTPAVYLEADLEELVRWWRRRKQFLESPAAYRETTKKTYVVPVALVEAIEAYATRKGFGVGEALTDLVRCGLADVGVEIGQEG